MYDFKDTKVALEEGSIFEFRPRDGFWQVIVLSLSPGMERQLAPYIDAAHKMVDRRYETLVAHGEFELTMPLYEDPVIQSIIDMLSRENYVYPKLRVERADGEDIDVTKIGKVVSILIGDEAGIERVLVTSRVRYTDTL